MNRRTVAIAALAILVGGCATVADVPPVSSGGATIETQRAAQVAVSTPVARPELKRKIAVGRFTNLTRYGKSLLTPGAPDPIANQAADILSNRLVETGKFLVFDRPSVELAQQTGALQGQDPGQFIGVDAIVVGAVTQFGRRDEGRSGFMSSTRRQVVEATVEARLVDVATGRIFFTASGSGTATTEVGEVAGFGSRAAYDDTLNDKALAAAIGDMMNNIVQRLTSRRWSTDVLELRPSAPLISGGPMQGLRVGDQFTLATKGTRVLSQSTGAAVALPGQDIATLEVVSFFGEDEFSQGAVTRIVRGTIPANVDIKTLEVVELRQ